MSRIGFVWLNIIGYVGVLIVNFLANALPIAGRDTGEISDMYPVLVTPASYAFSIWSLIYLLLGGFVILQALPRRRSDPRLEAIGPWFFLSCVLNGSWIIFWHYLQINISVIIMLALLGTLIILYLKTRSNTSLWFQAKEDRRDTLPAFLFIKLPFSIYLGWISVATIVNISVALYAADWGGWGLPDTFWSVAVLLVAALLALWIGHAYNDQAFRLVVIWALIAIGIKQVEHSAIAWSAWGLAFILLIAIVVSIFSKSRR